MSRHEREREGAGGPLAARHAARESGQDAAARGQHGRACTPLRGAHRTREAAGAAAQRLEEAAGSGAPAQPPPRPPRSARRRSRAPCPAITTAVVQLPTRRGDRQRRAWGRGRQAAATGGGGLRARSLPRSLAHRIARSWLSPGVSESVESPRAPAARRSTAAGRLPPAMGGQRPRSDAAPAERSSIMKPMMCQQHGAAVPTADHRRRRLDFLDPPAPVERKREQDDAAAACSLKRTARQLEETGRPAAERTPAARAARGDSRLLWP